MSQIYNVLLIDDHPIIADAYKSAFEFINAENEDVEFDIKIVTNCDDAIIAIEQASKKEGLDIVFLDISLPPSSDGKYLSGEDIGIRIKQVLPKCKIIVATTFNDNYRIQSILKNMNPDGFLIKNDVSPKELVSSIVEVLTNPPYYSKTVMKLFRNQLTNDFILDDIDRKILYELSLGTKLKNIENVPLSTSGILKRKRHLMQIFDLESSDDRGLIIMAKEKGFI